MRKTSLFIVLLALSTGCSSTKEAASTQTTPPPTPFAEQIAGTWASATCESAGPAGFLKKKFVITPTNFTIQVDLYGDDKCTAGLLTANIQGPITVVGESSNVEGAYEVNYVMSTRMITPHVPPLVDQLNTAKCGGKSDWALDKAGDITITGCPAIGFEPNPPCDKEMDLNLLDGNNLFFGDRSSSLCQARPTKLAMLPVVRQ